jgi:hypothetical protein
MCGSGYTVERVGRKDPPLGPFFILESSQVVSWEDAQKQQEREAAAAANNKRNGFGSGSAPATNKRRYRWPAKTVIYTVVTRLMNLVCIIYIL